MVVECVVALALAAVGCYGYDEPLESNRGGDGTAPPEGAGATPEGEEIVGAPDTSAGDHFDSGGDIGGGTPLPFFQGNIFTLGAAPCGPTGWINDLDEVNADGYGTCTDLTQTFSLFKFTPAGIVDSWALKHSPDQLAGLDQAPGLFYFSGQDVIANQWGWGYIDLTKPAPEASFTELWLPFPPVTVGAQTFVPSFAKGIASYNDVVYIATSNLYFTPEGTTSYWPGTVLWFDLQNNAKGTIKTSQLNPTSLGVIPFGIGKQIGVMNSGPVDMQGNTAGWSSLDRIDPVAQTASAVTIKLPIGGLGLSGEIAVGGGRLAVGSADNSGWIVILPVDKLNTSPTEITIVAMPGTDTAGSAHFISLVKFLADGTVFVAGDFNTGLLAAWDVTVDPPVLLGEPIALDPNLDDANGIGDGAWLPNEGAGNQRTFVVAVGKELIGLPH